MPLRRGAPGHFPTTDSHHQMQLLDLHSARGTVGSLRILRGKIEGHPENTSAYVWGKETLRTIRCTTCGCATHWEALTPQAGAEVGVNMNNFDQGLIQGTPVRIFDGANTWTYLDNAPEQTRGREQAGHNGKKHSVGQ